MRRSKECNMKVGQSNTQGLGTPGSVRGAAEVAEVAKTGTRAAGAGEAGAGSTVQISSAARALLEGGEAGFDAAKVQRVRDAIANGTYQIDAGAIADKLIANARELLGKS
jgi:negative regulator of flagellin synthesis FlgM